MKPAIKNQITFLLGDAFMKTEIRELIEKSNGKIFTVVFKKKNGEVREMQARLGVKKGLVDPSNPKPKYDAKSKGLITVWSLKDNDYRAISVDSIIKLTMNGETHYPLLPETITEYYLKNKLWDKITNIVKETDNTITVFMSEDYLTWLFDDNKWGVQLLSLAKEKFPKQYKAYCEGIINEEELIDYIRRMDN